MDKAYFFKAKTLTGQRLIVHMHTVELDKDLF